MLKDLSAAGIRLAVVSNKFQEGTERLIRHFFPGIPFAAILGNRPGCPLKPSPDIVRETLDLAGARPADALLVGDSPTDMHTAAAGGIDAIAVTWGYRSATDLTAALPQPDETAATTPQPDSTAAFRLIDSVPALRRALLSDCA